MSVVVPVSLPLVVDPPAAYGWLGVSGASGRVRPPGALHRQLPLLPAQRLPPERGALRGRLLLLLQRSVRQPQGPVPDAVGTE